MTFAFLNYVKDEAHGLIGYAQENAVVETKNRRSDVAYNNKKLDSH